MSSTISAGMSDGDPRLHFGGPDRPPRVLRTLLRNKVDAVPAGGAIVWATYYFRDRDLADALIAASDRGVAVTLHVEGHPRRASVNHHVIERLRRHGLNGGLHVHAPALPMLAKAHAHLHSKIYAFTHPQPVALVGSFNPSGDVPEDADVIAEIGDQDRGHNLLIELTDPVLVTALVRHVQALHRPFARMRPAQNQVIASTDTQIWFYPRLRTDILGGHIRAAGPASRIRGAISHLKQGDLANDLARAARAGASVRLLVHDTERRVPEAAVAMLAAAGVDIGRYRHAEHLPLHAKFLLVAERGCETAWFGSFNYNPRSRWLNRELLVASRGRAIVEALGDRFETIAAETAAIARPC